MGSNTSGDPPDGPTGLPLVGNTHQFLRDQLGFLERCAEYGDVARFRVGGRETYLATHPDDVKQVLSTDHDRFRKGEFQKRRLGRVVGSGLLTSEGEAWQTQRQRIQPAFTPDRIAGYADAMVECTEDVLSEWEDGDVVELDTEMQHLTLRILVRTLFGTDVDAHVETVDDAVDAIRNWNSFGSVRTLLPDSVPTPQGRRGKRALRALDGVIEDLVDERRRDSEWGDDLLSTLVRATDGAEISTDRLRDQLVTFLLAGHETTALSLTYAWHLIATNSEPATRFRRELDAVLGGRAPTVADLEDLPVTERVLDESMRLYPAVPRLSRVPEEPITLENHEVPAGAMVMLPQWVVHRDPRWWDDPEAFRPARWTDDEDRPDYAFFPFGGGPRRCIGDWFSRVEARLVLATVGQRVTFERHEETLPNFDVGVTASPAERVTATVRTR